MKILRCSDVGEKTCNFIAEGKSVEEVERKILDHASDRHPTLVQSMSIDDRDQFIAQMDAMVEDE